MKSGACGTALQCHEISLHHVFTKDSPSITHGEDKVSLTCLLLPLQKGFVHAQRSVPADHRSLLLFFCNLLQPFLCLHFPGALSVELVRQRLPCFLGSETTSVLVIVHDVNIRFVVLERLQVFAGFLLFPNTILVLSLCLIPGYLRATAVFPSPAELRDDVDRQATDLVEAAFFLDPSHPHSE